MKLMQRVFGMKTREMGHKMYGLEAGLDFWLILILNGNSET